LNRCPLNATVTVVPAGEVPLYCSDGNYKYGQAYDSPKGRTLVNISVSLPAIK
jgi:hypothetical protein